MTTLYSGIQIALRALLAHQQTVQVIEHNVANANTRGYRRQGAVLTPGHPYAPPGLTSTVTSGQMGSGVLVDRIQRFSVDFFDNRYRNEVSQSAQWDLTNNILSQLEVTLSETTGDGLSARLDAFWNGWQALSADPGNEALRADLYERSTYLTDGFNRRVLALTALRSDQNQALIQRVDEVNVVARQVARLNAEISNVYSVGNQPNDLLDQRDLLLDRLAELGGAVAHEQSNHQVMVSIGGHALIVGNSHFELQTNPDPTNSNLAAVTWSDGQSLNLNSGELAGLIYARDTVIVDRLNGLNSLATALIARVNAVHQGGYGTNNATGLDFFTGSDALSMRVNSAMSDYANIASATAADSPGDGSVATAIAAVRDELLLSAGTATLGDFYTGEATRLGLEISRARTYANDRGLVAKSLDAQRQTVSGVSLDEEAANLVQAQRAYQAAARLMTTVDEMIDRVINGMGRVGL